ncbi:hypothetical protein TcCL_NonESM10579 [Trypanosoma cruzi]|nr:hypothetical protein TcCL_NonESM10579 [Trypanosoma cruzi]
MTDRQAEGDGCRQEALKINMAREHAATPRRNTGEKDERGKKQEAAQHTRKRQTTDGESTAAALALAGNSTPVLNYTPSRCCQSPGERIRPSTQQTHTEPAVTYRGRGGTTHSLRLQLNPTDNGIRPQPAAGTQRTRSKQSPKEPHAEADPHPCMTRRLTPRGHTECTVSSMELMPRPSLKDASSNNGAWNTIEKK